MGLTLGQVWAQDLPQILEDETHQWMQRVDEAAQHTDFQGTYVVVRPNQLFTLQVTHIGLPHKGDSAIEYELVKKLDGHDHHIFRQGDAFYAVFPDAQQAILESKSMSQMFPALLRAGGGQPSFLYDLILQEDERVVNRMAYTFSMVPKDNWRFSYKIWVDQLTGLMLRIQVLDEQKYVLEQVAFTNIDMSVSDEQKKELLEYLKNLTQQGYQFHELQLTSTTPQQEGWALDQRVPGFEPISFVRRPLTQTSQELIQWIFSDGVVSVSIFIEPVSPYVRREASSYSNGATHSLTFQYEQWWITLVGEVPPHTLEQFAQNLKKIAD